MRYIFNLKLGRTCLTMISTTLFIALLFLCSNKLCCFGSQRGLGTVLYFKTCEDAASGNELSRLRSKRDV